MNINDREYKIIIPQYDNSGNKIDPKQIEHFAKKMAEHFGGVTVIPNVLGCWKDESGKLQCEKTQCLFPTTTASHIRIGLNGKLKASGS